MFGLLKKKIASFIDQLTNKEERKDEPQPPEKQRVQPTAPVEFQPPKPVAPIQPAMPVQIPKSHAALLTQQDPPTHYAHVSQTKPSITKASSETVPAVATAPAAAKTIQTPKTEPQRTTTPTNPDAPQPSQTRTQTEPATATPKTFQTRPTVTQSIASIKPTEKTPEPMPKTAVQSEPQKERKLEAKLGIFTQLKSLITQEVQIQPSELEPMLDELNLALLESDVTLDTADHITSTIKAQLSGKKVEKNRVQAEIQAAVKTALIEVLDRPPLDLLDYIHSHEKPVKILFLGPNGAGKTTTLAKIAFFFKQHNLRCVLAAADTFRAAAIEQLQHHGSTIGVPVIKHQYGADPAAVAFDAIAHAKSHGADVVLIDTAGRQETNYNLLKEMEKINRVIKPDLKLFIGEAVAGHALVEQAKAFHAALKLDGVVLTKVDCDAKGGTSFSVSHEVGVPIVLLGTGQEYGDMRSFAPEWLVSNVLAE